MRVTLFTILVREYDEAIAFYTRSLGLTLLEDTDLSNGKRWVRVGTPCGKHPELLLARATTPEQRERIGSQTGGRVCGFIETDNVERDHEAMQSRGVVFEAPARDEPYGTVAVFKDLYGNRWDLIQPRESAPGPVAGDPLITLENFEKQAIPLDSWNHRAHLTIAYLYLRAHGFDEAVKRMRRGVQAYNAAKGIQTTATSGYHETLTVAWMYVLHATMTTHSPGADAQDFLIQQPYLLSRTLLRLYYSRERLMSEEARNRFVAPDLAPLPMAPGASSDPRRS